MLKKVLALSTLALGLTFANDDAITCTWQNAIRVTPQLISEAIRAYKMESKVNKLFGLVTDKRGNQLLVEIGVTTTDLSKVNIPLLKLLQGCVDLTVSPAIASKARKPVIHIEQGLPVIYHGSYITRVPDKLAKCTKFTVNGKDLGLYLCTF